MPTKERARALRYIAFAELIDSRVEDYIAPEPGVLSEEDYKVMARLFGEWGELSFDEGAYEYHAFADDPAPAREHRVMCLLMMAAICGDRSGE